MKYEDSHPKLYRFSCHADREYKNLDGITITIPDHMHSTVALWAMGGDCTYCRSRLLKPSGPFIIEGSKKYNVVTQMGNRLSSRQTAKYVKSSGAEKLAMSEQGILGGGGFSRGVTEWQRRRFGYSHVGPLDRRAQSIAIVQIHPINWRGFQEYGSQMVGDCEFMLGPANWALQRIVQSVLNAQR